MEWGLHVAQDGLEFLLEASESHELRKCPEARMFWRRCPRFCLLEVLGSLDPTLWHVSPSKETRVLFTKIDNDQDHDHFQPF